MVCVSCNAITTAASLSSHSLFPSSCGTVPFSIPLISSNGNLFPLPSLPLRHRRRNFFHRCDMSASGPTPAPSNFNPMQRHLSQKLGSSLFPAGFRRPEIRVPTTVLKVSAAEVLQSKATIDKALSTGSVGIVVLEGDDSGGQLYEVACVLRSIIRERAYFLIAERVDVAAAVGASGVVLSDQGLPVIVARNMLMNSKAESVFLPIVARNVLTAGSALNASASEGADFIIFGIDERNYSKILEGSIRIQNIKVPIFLDIIDCAGEGSPFDVATKLLQPDASGLVISMDDMEMLSYNISSIFSVAKEPNTELKDGSQYLHDENSDILLRESRQRSLVAGFSKLNDKEIKLIEVERSILIEAIAIIYKAAPMVIF